MTKYSPKVVNTIFEKMSEGYSLVAAAAFADVGRRTVYEWIDQHPEFAELYSLAQAKRQAYWETEALTTQSGPRVTMITKALGGMRSADWSDDSRLQVDVNHSHNHTLKLGELSADQLESLALMLAPKTSDVLVIEHAPSDEDS